MIPLPSYFESFIGLSLQRTDFPPKVSIVASSIFLSSYSSVHCDSVSQSMRTVSDDANRPPTFSTMNWFT